MTVATQIQQTIAAAQSVSANLKNFALETQNQDLRHTYNQLAQDMDGIIAKLEGRLDHIQDEEPQYRES
ncbi:MAG: DUF1657 domain-containing protein [Limnochordia bacterium]